MVANTDQDELLKRQAMMFVLKVITGLNRFNIKNSIFHTGISHHLDSSLVEIACSTIDVPQIFLYSNSINERLLPMIQIKSIKDRKVYGKKISKYDSGFEISRFYQNKLQDKWPEVSIAWSARHESAAFAIYRLFRDSVRNFFRTS